MPFWPVCLCEFLATVYRQTRQGSQPASVCKQDEDLSLHHYPNMVMTKEEEMVAHLSQQIVWWKKSLLLCARQSYRVTVDAFPTSVPCLFTKWTRNASTVTLYDCLAYNNKKILASIPLVPVCNNFFFSFCAMDCGEPGSAPGAACAWKLPEAVCAFLVQHSQHTVAETANLRFTADMVFLFPLTFLPHRLPCGDSKGEIP